MNISKSRLTEIIPNEGFFTQMFDMQTWKYDKQTIESIRFYDVDKDKENIYKRLILCDNGRFGYANSAYPRWGEWKDNGKSICLIFDFKKR